MPALRERAKRSDFEHDCERLRPLGEAYVLRQFSGLLSRADAEDAVAEVLVRIHRQMAAGRPPRNLRAAFFTGVRNQAIELLRSRARRPSIALDAVGELADDQNSPAERAEAREDTERFQEALARLRTNQREAIMLRFGLGMTVPELSRHFGISLPAAKKLVARATRQVRKRAEAIDDADYCPEMRQLARRSLLERHASGALENGEGEVLRRHFEHCGACKSFIANFHYGLHEAAGGALIAAGAGDQLSGHAALTDHALALMGQLGDGAHTAAEKLRLAAFRATSILHGGDPSSAGMLASTGQKIAAICGAGAIAAGTCAATGVVGPGLALPDDHGPPTKTTVSAPADTVPTTTSVPSTPTTSVPSDQSAPVQQPVNPVQQVTKELYGGGSTSGSSSSGSRDFAAPVSSSSTTSGGGGGGSATGRENFGP
jgi:RNA polymerase sigma factor (sigma-70 family)